MRSQLFLFSPFGAAAIVEQLSQEEKTACDDHFPLLLKVARAVAPRWDDAVSVGFFGLLHGLRTYDASRASLETWLTSRIRWAIQDGLRRERTRRVASLDLMIDDWGFDVEDHRGRLDADTQAMIDALGELPEADQDLTWAYLSTGNLDRAAGVVGLPQAVARRRMAQLKEYLTNFNVQIDP